MGSINDLQKKKRSQIIYFEMRKWCVLLIGQSDTEIR